MLLKLFLLNGCIREKDRWMSLNPCCFCMADTVAVFTSLFQPGSHYFKLKFKFIIAISTVYKIQLIGICFGVLTCITQQRNNTTLQDRKPKRHINNKEYNT
ncbi:unnamed protein product [Boreogadus saida]